MDIAEHEQVANLGAFEREDRHACPPHMFAARRHPEHLFTVNAVEPHLAADAIPFLDHRNDVGGVVAEHTGYPVDVVRELLVADERWTQRTAKCKISMEDFLV